MLVILVGVALFTAIIVLLVLIILIRFPELSLALTR